MADRSNVLAARVLLEARRAARTFGHTWIGSEHVLLGILALGEGDAHRVLRNHGVDSKQVREELSQLLPSVEQPKKADIPLAQSLQQLLTDAVSRTEARELEAVHVEHLLLSLLRQRAGLGYAILVKQGIDLDGLERDVLRRGEAAERSQ